MRPLNHPDFRQDLFYRLNVAQLHLPPLSEREDDALILLNTSLKKRTAKPERPVKPIAMPCCRMHGRAMCVNCVMLRFVLRWMKA